LDKGKKKEKKQPEMPLIALQNSEKFLPQQVVTLPMDSI